MTENDDANNQFSLVGHENKPNGKLLSFYEANNEWAEPNKHEIVVNYTLKPTVNEHVINSSLRYNNGHYQ